MTDVREGLCAQRAQAKERIAALAADFQRFVDAGDGTNIDDEHDPEGATIAFERSQVAALLEAARARVVELERALQALNEGDYGICERCGRPIGAGRLAARPSARTCIDCARDANRA